MEFSALVMPYLAEGLVLGDRVMYATNSPDMSAVRRLRNIAGAGAIDVASVTEIYGTSGVVDPPAQRAVFASVLADSLAAGFSGIRVAADNTSLVREEGARMAWMDWEAVADDFIAGNSVTGLCGFDGRLLPPGVLGGLASMHPLTEAAIPPPRYRIYRDGPALWLTGDPDRAAMTWVRRALAHLPARCALVVDLLSARKIDEAVLASLRRLAEEGASVTIRGTRTVIGLIADLAAPPVANLVLREA